MARPKPKIILEYTDPKTFRSEQVLGASAIYAVFFKNKPVNLRSLNSLVNYPGPKYKKVSFSNSGHAFNLAQRLNKLFKTDEFTVVKLTQGETIRDDDDNSFL
jgi:predicted nucleic acid-binding protein